MSRQLARGATQQHFCAIEIAAAVIGDATQIQRVQIVRLTGKRLFEKLQSQIAVVLAQIVLPHKDQRFGARKPAIERCGPFRLQLWIVGVTQIRVEISAMSASRLSSIRMPDARLFFDETGIRRARATDGEILALELRKMRTEARAFLDQTAMESGCDRCGPVLEIVLSVKSGKSAHAATRPIHLAHARLRVDNPAPHRTRVIEQCFDMMRRQFVIIVQQVQPLALGHVETGVGRAGSIEGNIWNHES